MREIRQMWRRSSWPLRAFLAFCFAYIAACYVGAAAVGIWWLVDWAR